MGTRYTIKRRIASAGFVAAVMAFGIASPPAIASPTITALFVPGDFTAADEAVIQNALNFYTANMTSTFTVSVAFGTQTDGGATSIKSVYNAMTTRVTTLLWRRTRRLH
jgi:hypothetical protein